jgi:tRNA-specific 2-thiouridylase
MKAVRGKTVFVGLSGGVDSSVAALRLIQEGYTVVGVFIKVWHPDFLECNWEKERLDAMRVAAKLDIPFLTCDAEQAYKDDVADYFISQYKKGNTPNPDVMCNKYVKFGAFLKFAEEHNADFIATGHYAERVAVQGAFQLLRGRDNNKDQSYFLWTLTQKQLAKVLLPIGNSTKDIIRKEADEAGLITAAKKDSQGICFLGHIDIPEFLSHYTELKEGSVLNTNGDVIGTHQGALVYTSGQRHGFTISKRDPSRPPLYVVSRDIQKNTITVSEKKPIKVQDSNLLLSQLNYIAWTPQVGSILSVQTRYRQRPVVCEVLGFDEEQLILRYTEDGEEVSEGQSCVLYDGNRCVGGGIISSCHSMSLRLTEAQSPLM